MFDHLHTVIKNPGQFKDSSPAASGWLNCCGVTLPLGSKTADLTGAAQVRGIQSPPRRCDHRWTRKTDKISVKPFSTDEVLEKGQGRGHAPVLEGSAGILAVVLIIKRRADHFRLPLVGRHHPECVLRPGIIHLPGGNDRRQKTRGIKHPAKRRLVEHAAIIEDSGAFRRPDSSASRSWYTYP